MYSGAFPWTATVPSLMCAWSTGICACSAISSSSRRRSNDLPAYSRLCGSGNALSDVCLGQGGGIESFDGVIVEVDEAWSKHEPESVEDLLAGSLRKLSDAGDAIVADAQGAFAERGAGAVGELGVDD